MYLILKLDVTSGNFNDIYYFQALQTKCEKYNTTRIEQQCHNKTEERCRQDFEYICHEYKKPHYPPYPKPKPIHYTTPAPVYTPSPPPAYTTAAPAYTTSVPVYSSTVPSSVLPPVRQPKYGSKLYRGKRESDSFEPDPWPTPDPWPKHPGIDKPFKHLGAFKLIRKK